MSDVPQRMSYPWAATAEPPDTIASSDFRCHICGELSEEICRRCTRDSCDNHVCERCRRCSDCCECE